MCSKWAKDARRDYFPAAHVQGSYELHELIAESYCSVLNQFLEPALYSPDERDSHKEAYRILCIPTYDHPYLLRLTRDADHIAAVYKEVERLDIYSLGRIKRTRSVALTPQHWDDLEHLLERYHFWTVPLHGESSGKDGEDWLMEGVRGPRYRAFTRWCGGVIEAIFLGLSRKLPANLMDDK